MLNREAIEPPEMRPVMQLLRSRWPGSNDAVFVRNFSNAVYCLTNAEGRFYLRITEDSKRSLQMIASELEFVNYLNAHGIPVACPLLSSSDNLVETVAIDVTVYNACMFEEAPGIEYRHLVALDKSRFFKSCGALLGRLHAASRKFRPSTTFTRFDWNEDRWHSFKKYVPKSETDAWRQYEEIMAWLGGLPKSPAYFGFIHGDYNITNMRFDGPRITLFDFDASCRHWYAYDIACFLHYFGAGDENSRKLAYESTLDGYGQSARLDSELLAHIPLFGKMRLLYSFLVFAEEWGFENLNPQQESYFEHRRRLFRQEPTWPETGDM